MFNFFINTAQAVSLPSFTSPDLPNFIKDVYSFSITIVGIAVFVQFLIAGYFYLTGGAFPGRISEANEKMKNAVIGTVLLLSAWLILNIINPDLVKNSFDFSIPGTSQTSPNNRSVGQTVSTPASVAIAGMIGISPGTKSSFWFLPIAQAMESGNYSFAIKATDANGDSCEKTYNIEVSPNIGSSNIIDTGSVSLIIDSGPVAGPIATPPPGSVVTNPFTKENQVYATILDKSAMIELASTQTHDQVVAKFGSGVEQFFGENVTAQDIPQTFSGTSYIAWALSLGGQNQEGNQVGNFVYRSGNWYRVESTVAGATPDPIPAAPPKIDEVFTNYVGLAVTGMWVQKDFFNARVGNELRASTRVWYSNDNQSFEQDSNVSVTSSNNAIATAEVDKKAGEIIIKIVKAGQATITAHPVALGSDRTKDKTIKIKAVDQNVTISRLVLSKANITLTANSSTTISAAVYLSDGTSNPGVEVFSSDPNLVSGSGDANGVVYISASNLPINQMTELGSVYQSYVSTLTIRPTLAGNDTSFDKQINVTVMPSEENQLPIPAAEPEIPAYIFEMSANKTLASLTQDQIYELNSYFEENNGVMPSSFVPGSWFAFQMNLGDQTPTSTNGLPLQSIILGYQWDGNRYTSAFKVSSSNAVGIKISESPDTVKAITDGFNKVANPIGYAQNANVVAGFVLNNFAQSTASIIGSNMAYKAFSVVLHSVGKVLLPVGIIMTGVEAINWYNNHRRTQHYKEDDTAIANAMMAKVAIVMNTYNNNRAPDAELEKKYHDAAVTVVYNIFNTSASYFKLSNSFDSQKAYLQDYIRSMDQTLAQRTGSATLQIKNTLASIWNGFADLFKTKEVSNKAAIIEQVQADDSCGMVKLSPESIPDAVEGTPYYAQISAVGGQGPYTYTITKGSLPEGVTLQAVIEMPIMTLENLTAKRTPSYAFNQTDKFRLTLTGGAPNSDIYIKWQKNGERWFYSGTQPNSEGWTVFGVTDDKGKWVNEANFNPDVVGVWYEWAMVEGKISKPVGFEVVGPQTKIVMATPSPGISTVVNPSGGQTVGACTPVKYCEDKITGERNYENWKIPDANVQGGIRTQCPTGWRLVDTCTYSYSSTSSLCDKAAFEARNCQEEYDAKTVPEYYSPSGEPIASIPGGSLYLADRLLVSSDNNSAQRIEKGVIMCKYTNAEQVMKQCGGSWIGDWCLPQPHYYCGKPGYENYWCYPDGYAGYNTDWCFR